MEAALKVIRELRDRGVIYDFAIGGGIAVLYYVEPLLTYDLDVFFIPTEERFNPLGALKAEREHVIIEGVPVQFIPVYNELIREAVEKSNKVKYGRISTRVVEAEYLVVIMLQTYRPKDRERLIKIFEEVRLDLKFLISLLRRFHLYERYIQFREKYFESG